MLKAYFVDSLYKIDDEDLQSCGKRGYITACPNCGMTSTCDGAHRWNFCPECGKDMRVPGPYYVPPLEEWMRQYGTNKQIAGFEKRRSQTRG